MWQGEMLKCVGFANFFLSNGIPYFVPDKIIEKEEDSSSQMIIP